MAATKFRISAYDKAAANMAGGEAGADSFQTDYLTNTMKVALLSSAHTLSLGTHETYADLTNELSGGGYTAGGITLAAKTVTVTAANSWATTWAATTVYKAGDVVRPTSGNGSLYRAAVGGTSGGSQPTFPTTTYLSVTDGGVTWVNMGRSITVFDADDPTYGPNFTGVARTAHVYRDSGTASLSPLLWAIEFVQSDGVTPDDVSVSDDSLVIVLPALGLSDFFVAPGAVA